MGVMDSKVWRWESVQHHHLSPSIAICTMIFMLLLRGNETGCEHNDLVENGIDTVLNVCREEVPSCSVIFSIYCDISPSFLHGTWWEAENRNQVWHGSVGTGHRVWLETGGSETCSPWCQDRDQFYFSSGSTNYLTVSPFLDSINQWLSGPKKHLNWRDPTPCDQSSCKTF